MVAQSDILRFRTNMEFEGKDCINVFHMRMLSNPEPGYNSMLAMAIGFTESVMRGVMVLLTSGVTLNNVYVENLSENGRPFANLPLNITGNQANDAYASFGALSVRQEVSTRVTRNGYKRFVGVPENNVTNGVFVSGYMTLFQTTVSNKLGGTNILFTSDISGGDDIITAAHIILKTVHSDPPANGEWQFVTSANALDRPTTQNSRKVLGN